jgi:hypothetical protein
MMAGGVLTGMRRGARAVVLLALLGLAATTTGARYDGFNPYATDGSGQPLYAIRTPDLYYHNVGLLQMLVSNVGVVGNPFGSDLYGAGWRGGEYLYAASLWFGAIAPDNLAYVSTGAYDYELRPPLDPVYTIYESYEGITGGNRAGFASDKGDDDGDGAVDEDFSNGIDDDGDGTIDEDYQAISQQMFACEYWDNTEEARSQYAEHRPMNLRVRQRSFAWSTEGANEFVGIDYVVLNQGWETLRQIYLGYFVDSDAGNKSADNYWTDDGGELRSVDTTYVDRTIIYSCEERIGGDTHVCSRQDLHIDIAYMHDTPGSQPGGNAADDMAPGSDGFFGGMFLGHTTDPFGERAPERVQIYTCAFFSGSGVYPEGDPRNDYQRYDLLSKGTKPRRPTSQPSDYRYCFSAGPFSELLPGEELHFQVAFVVGSGWSGLINNAIMAQRVYNGQWRDVDANPLTGCEGMETCLHVEEVSEPLFWQDPCDSISPRQGPFKNLECDDPAYWRDADCNCCTPIQDDATSCPGKETLIHWVGTVAPPPPHVSTEDAVLRVQLAGDQQVRVAWDNTSELVADPIQQKILFTGYEVWRVEGWQRPLGSTGPTPSEWQKVATLTRDPIGVELDLDDYTFEVAVTDSNVVNPENPEAPLKRYEVGRYAYEDSSGLKNGMVYFYDVTAYSSWIDDNGKLQVLSSQPAAVEVEAVRPLWGTSTGASWKDAVIVVPNPWRGGTEADLTPSDADPTGTRIYFAHLPDKPCTVRIYTLAGDLVQTLSNVGVGSQPTGTVAWPLLSRRGQEITSGVYLYAVTCDNETTLGRFTVIR